MKWLIFASILCLGSAEMMLGGKSKVDISKEEAKEKYLSTSISEINAQLSKLGLKGVDKDHDDIKLEKVETQVSLQIICFFLHCSQLLGVLGDK